MPVKRVVKPAQNAGGIGDGGHFGDLFGAQDFGLQPHVAMFGTLCLEHIEPFGGIGKRHAANVMQPARHAGQGLEFAVKPDGVPLQGGHVGVAVEGVKPARRMPRGAAGQFRTLQQHHIGPAELCQMIKHRTSHDTAADHTNPSGAFHRHTPSTLWGNIACGFRNAQAQRVVIAKTRRAG